MSGYASWKCYGCGVSGPGTTEQLDAHCETLSHLRREQRDLFEAASRAVNALRDFESEHPELPPFLIQVGDERRPYV